MVESDVTAKVRVNAAMRRDHRMTSHARRSISRLVKTGATTSMCGGEASTGEQGEAVKGARLKGEQSAGPSG